MVTTVGMWLNISHTTIPYTHTHSIPFHLHSLHSSPATLTPFLSTKHQCFTPTLSVFPNIFNLPQTSPTHLKHLQTPKILLNTPHKGMRCTVASTESQYSSSPKSSATWSLSGLCPCSSLPPSLIGWPVCSFFNLNILFVFYILFK